MSTTPPTSPPADATARKRKYVAIYEDFQKQFDEQKQKVKLMTESVKEAEKYLEELQDRLSEEQVEERKLRGLLDALETCVHGDNTKQLWDTRANGGSRMVRRRGSLKRQKVLHLNSSDDEETRSESKKSPERRIQPSRKQSRERYEKNGGRDFDDAESCGSKSVRSNGKPSEDEEETSSSSSSEHDDEDDSEYRASKPKTSASPKRHGSSCATIAIRVDDPSKGSDGIYARKHEDKYFENQREAGKVIGPQLVNVSGNVSFSERGKFKPIRKRLSGGKFEWYMFIRAHKTVAVCEETGDSTEYAHQFAAAKAMDISTYQIWYSVHKNEACSCAKDGKRYMFRLAA